jgi:hypothetical protein
MILLLPGDPDSLERRRGNPGVFATDIDEQARHCDAARSMDGVFDAAADGEGTHGWMFDEK